MIFFIFRKISDLLGKLLVFGLDGDYLKTLGVIELHPSVMIKITIGLSWLRTMKVSSDTSMQRKDCWISDIKYRLSMKSYPFY